MRNGGFIGLALAATVLAGCAGQAPAPVVQTQAQASTPRPTVRTTPRPTVTPRATSTASVPATAEPTASPEPDPSLDPRADWPQGAISGAKAKSKVGKVAIVCGKVVRAKYAKSTRGKPTFLDLDKPYPHAPVTIVIWREERGEFATAPEKAFLDEVVCIEGRVERYKGKVQVTAAGGDVFPASEFRPWPKDAMSCVREGSRMSFDCSVWLDVVVEMRRIEDAQAQDMMDAYDDAMDDIYSDPGFDPWVPDYP